MPNLRSLFSGLLRRGSHREHTVGNGGPVPNAAPAPLCGAAVGTTGQVTARTTVESEQRFEGNVNTSVLHDVLVSAGVNLEANDMSVVVGAPRLLSSNMVTSKDGKFIDRDEEIEVRVVIRTRQRLALFVEAMAGATLEGTTLTLTPTPATPPKVVTTVEHTPGGSTTETATAGARSQP